MFRTFRTFQTFRTCRTMFRTNIAILGFSVTRQTAMPIRIVPRFCARGYGRFEKLLYGCRNPSRWDKTGVRHWHSTLAFNIDIQLWHSSLTIIIGIQHWHSESASNINIQHQWLAMGGWRQRRQPSDFFMDFLTILFFLQTYFSKFIFPAHMLFCFWYF